MEPKEMPTFNAIAICGFAINLIVLKILVEKQVVPLSEIAAAIDQATLLVEE